MLLRSLYLDREANIVFYPRPVMTRKCVSASVSTRVVHGLPTSEVRDQLAKIELAAIYSI